MASFNKTIITNNGRSLIAKVISGDQIKFTKMVSSSRDYTSFDLSQLTDLSNVEQTIVISSIKKTSDSAVKITGIFSNKDLKTGYKFKTVGLYAIDPDLGEILYSVTTASSVDDMPANTGIGLSSITIGLVTDVSNSNNASLEVSDVATVSALEFNEFKDDVNSHLNNITNSGYFDISKDAKGAHYKTIKENGFYRNVTGTPTTGTGGVLLVISNTDKWSVAYKWLSISNTVITEYNACKDGDNYEEWKEISTNDTGWLNLPLSSGVVVDSGLTPQYRKIGNRVFIRGSVKNILNGNSVIGTLPVGFRPVLQNHHYATFTNTNACASFNISTDGRIIYQGNSTNTFNAEWFVVITNNFII
ncbi:hypothetical protein HNS01_10840 [Clostridium butyricum]|uniref:hypothetical protein n=2 Tax=Clostridium butyricum TaxID=1492 RepID=UPI002107E9AD|nr:hypothetical protein [Clostridium butyricum]UTY53563.1 hypothetical protein HNS01_10840 [Clostridium butyricum]